MNDRGTYKFDDDVEIHEMLVDGYSAGKVGRNLDEKTVVMIEIEKLAEGRMGNSNFELREF